MIACFLSNISAKYYKNPSMLCRVIAKNVGDVFLRHSVYMVSVVCTRAARKENPNPNSNSHDHCLLSKSKCRTCEHTHLCN